MPCGATPHPAKTFDGFGRWLYGRPSSPLLDDDFSMSAKAHSCLIIHRRALWLLGNSLTRGFIANSYWQNRRKNRGINEGAVADKEIEAHMSRPTRAGATGLAGGMY